MRSVVIHPDSQQPPYVWRISCRPSCWRPHKPTLPLSGREEGRAGAEFRPTPACRLHARVGRHAGHDPVQPLPLQARGAVQGPRYAFSQLRTAKRAVPRTSRQTLP